MRRVITLLLCLVSPPLLASACLIESTDDQLPVRMCQQNGTIPPALFEQQFCQPRIPGREFRIQMQDSCPGTPTASAVAHTPRAWLINRISTITLPPMTRRF